MRLFVTKRFSLIKAALKQMHPGYKPARGARKKLNSINSTIVFVF